jgi:sec-independent protein translocase protein TatA
MGLSATHLLLLLVVVVLLFGRNKISDLMGDVARGIKSFKKGMAEDESAAEAAKALDHAGKPVVEAERDKSKTG